MSQFDKNFRETIDLRADSDTSDAGAGRNRMRLSPGDNFSDNYTLRVRLGRGGMGEIWKADELSNGKFLRQVVIKVVAPDIQNAELELKRIEDMFHKIHSLQHQHICPMYAMKEDPQYGFFIVMKYIDGITLQEYHDTYVKEHGSFPLSELVRLLAPIADALDYSHSKKVLHRDVKPQNIMVSRDESDGVQLIDFGLVADLHTSMTRSTMTQISTSGTLPYMSPEQWSGEYQDAQTDQFSLAVVAYELLSGRLPFVANDIQVLGFQILHKTPTPVEGLPDYANAALQRGLAKNRKERFATCADFVFALEHPEEKQPKKMTSGTKALIATLAAALILASVFALLRMRGSEERPPQLAQTSPPPAASGHKPGKPDLITEPEILTTTPPETPSPATSAEAPSTNTPPTVSSEPEIQLNTPAKPVSPPAVVPDTSPQDTSPAASAADTPEAPASPESVVEPDTQQPSPEPVPVRTSAEVLAEARQFFEAGSWAEAVPQFTLYLEMEADNAEPQALRQRAEAHEHLQQFSLAYADFQAYTHRETDPTAIIDALLDCANMCDEFRDYDHAVRVCNQLIRIMENTGNPQLAEVRRMRAVFLVESACQAMTREKYKVASTEIDVLLATAPGDSELLAEQARLLFTTRWEEKACDIAMAQLNDIIRRDPKCVKAPLYMGIMKRDIYNSRNEAIRDFQGLLETISDDIPAETAKHLRQAVYFQMALTWAGMGERESALRDFEQAEELAPNDPYVYYERGKLNVSAGKLDAAIEDFRKAMRVSPEYYASESALGKAYLQKAHAASGAAARKKLYEQAGKIFLGLTEKDANLKNHIEYNEQLIEVYKANNNRGEMERCKKRIQELKEMKH